MDTGFKVMTDCFAYDPKCRECKALTELLCKTKGKCSFYKKHIQDKVKVKPKHQPIYDKTRTSLSGVRFH